MLITFSIAASFSNVSSSSTISYLKSLFQSSTTDVTHGNDYKEKRVDDKNSNDNETKPQSSNIDNDNNNEQRDKQSISCLAKLAAECPKLFALYSSYMISLCVIALLLLLILQNTIASLSDDRFLVYYILSSLVTTTYGTIEYKAYLIMSWSLWMLWNILAIGTYILYFHYLNPNIFH